MKLSIVKYLNASVCQDYNFQIWSSKQQKNLFIGLFPENVFRFVQFDIPMFATFALIR